MKTTFHKTERFGHVDLFFMGSCRVSLLPAAPEQPKVHTCSDECSHSSSEEAKPATTEDESPTTYNYTKVFIRQGFKTHMIEIPEQLKIQSETFAKVFTCPYEELPEYLTTGSDTEQWLAELREDYLGSLDPIESDE